MRRVFAIALFLVYLPLSATTFAQTSNSTLGGTVSDSRGAGLPGVSIAAANTRTGIVTTVVSNESGAYQFPSLQPGNYKVTARLSEFQTQTYAGVSLGVSHQLRLNFALQAGAGEQSLETTIEPNSLLAVSSPSASFVFTEQKIRDLPSRYRNALDLIQITPAVRSSNVAGGRISQVNTIRDGISVNDGRYDNGIYSVNYVSSDLVDEMRIILAPVDAESGRGSRQVQLSTRSGSNAFGGSVFWANHNSALDANNWFSNFRGEAPDYLNRNQFGGRFGGPVFKNKTFFFFLYEGQRMAQRRYVTGPVLTAEARQGIFRYFPGVQNGNALATTPTVDLFGNPVRPAGATGGLLSFSVFGRDPLRPGFDPAGWVQKVISRMPMPNDFSGAGLPAGTTADGLNTAGYRWLRHEDGAETSEGTGTDVNRNQINFRVDQTLSANKKVSFAMSREHVYDNVEKALWPDGYDSENLRDPRTITSAFTWTLSPTLTNEMRFGRRVNTYVLNAQYDNTRTGKEVLDLLPKASGITFVPLMQLARGNFIDYVAGSNGHASFLYTYAHTLSWLTGNHAFKGGAELRVGHTRSTDAGNFYPVATFGAGGAAVTGIDNSTAPGLVAGNQVLARQLLTDLAGSVANIKQTFFLNDSTDLRFVSGSEQGGKTWDRRGKLRDLHQNEWSAFFKDEWKIQQNLTLNLGLRYEYYGVPWDRRGLLGHLVGGGTAGVFGISGTSFADMYQPGRMNGSLTLVEFVGKHSPNPQKQLYKNAGNNIAPAVGFSWSLPWWRKDRTVLRAGYGMSYQDGVRTFALESIAGGIPGVTYTNTFTSGNLFTLRNITLPLARITPLQPVPLTDRTQSLATFEDSVATPYIQNWNLELQHEIADDLTIEAHYIGGKGSKLFGGIPVNIANIFENGILDAFIATRNGGNAVLFDSMLRGLNLGSGVINGTTVTGSASLRNNTIFRSLLANGSVGQFAQTLANSSAITGVAGGLVRNGRYPENFITVNPQFSGVTLNGNPGNSTYHAMQLQMTRRLVRGFANSASYTWSRTLGESDSDGTLNYLNDRKRSTMKALLGFHRTHEIRSHSTYELPFGPGRSFLGNAPGWVSRVVERWQLGSILNWSSGAPLSLTVGNSTAGTASWNQFPNGPPMLVGDFGKDRGSVTTKPAGVVDYFDGLKQVVDPAVSNVTTQQNLQGSFSNFAIAEIGGKLLLINAGPGELGNLGLRWIEGPTSFSLDMNLIKRVKLAETKELELRVDAINVLNHPVFDNPNLNINSTDFGRITSAKGARTFVLNARVNF